MRPQKKKHHEKKIDFTHVHIREEGILADEAAEKQFEHSADDIEKGLRAIYKGSHTDLGVVTKATGGLTRILGTVVAWLFVLLLGGVFSLVAWTWWEDKSNPGEAVEVSITAPPTSRSGEEVTVEIAYKNPRSIALAQLSLDINIPQGFQPSIMLPAPTNEDQLIWNVGTLAQHSDGKILLTGRWYGDIPKDDRIQVVTTYRPANFNADFSFITTADIAVHESVLAVALTGPEKATAGEQVTYTATFTNNGIFPEEGEGEFILPQGFIPRAWTPELPAGGGTVWSLGVLEPGATFTQTVVGSFASEADDLQELKVTGWIKSTQGESYKQGESVWLTDVQGGELSVVLAGNGSTSTVLVSPGDQLRISVQLANVSDANVADAEILLDFQPESGLPIVWSGANVGKAKISARGVVLAPADVGVLAPAERKTYSFTFPLKDELSSSEISALSVTAFVASGGVTVQSIPLTVTLKGSASLSAKAQYYAPDGAPLGSGPFPPRVGEETTFILSWAFTRALHAMNNVTITATLPQNVRFSAVRSQTLGSVTYNDSSRVLTWNIANIPEEILAGDAEIEVTYVPSAVEEDTYGKLLSGSVFRGEDAQTGAVITAQAGEVTTEMPEDAVAAGKGIVRD